MARTPQLVSLALALTLALTGASLALEEEPAEAAGVSARLGVARPLVAERVAVRGAIGPATRKVVLQLAANGRWSTVKSTRTGKGGSYAFRVTARSGATKVRVVAPATRVGGKRYATRSSRVVTVKGVRGSGRIGIAPAPVGQSRDRRAGLTPGTAAFSPARPGSGVRIERRVGGKWLKAAGATQDRRGRVRYNLRAVKPGNTSAYRAVTAPGNGAARIVTKTIVPRAQKRVFADGFDSGAKYRDQWATRDEGEYYGRRMCAAPSRSRVSLTNGSARLSVKQVGRKGRTSPDDRTFRCVGGIWQNAMVGTGRAPKPFSFRYGTAAARVQFQPGQGMHSAFWLQTMGAGGAEIDIAEYYGNGYWAGLQTKIHQTLANGGLRTYGGTMNLSPVLARGKTPASGWHVYSVEWTPKRYVFRVDGVVTMVTSRPHVSQAQQEVVLSLLTSDWALDDRVLKTKESSRMAVDWVQVWQDPQYIGR